MIAVIGLGNPGPRYQNTRHNLGFNVVDKLNTHLKLAWSKDDRLAAEVALGRHGSQDVVLIKPLTFMNLSGQAVQKALQKYRLKPSDCWVVVDDIALKPGAYRVRQGGSAGGHNGLKSIIETIGDQFYRFRLGVGEPVDFPLETWVLMKPTAEEQLTLRNVEDLVVTEILRSLTEGQPTVTSHKG